jgi:hypothetical protein
METRIDEIADGIYRLSTYMAEVAPPAGFTFNQFLVTGDEPLLFHCGLRGMFPSVSAALGRIIPVERLRWISFGHIEADECGAMNLWLQAAPQATPLPAAVAPWSLVAATLTGFRCVRAPSLMRAAPSGSPGRLVQRWTQDRSPGSKQGVRGSSRLLRGSARCARVR